jgi:hypothetical protein
MAINTDNGRQYPLTARVAFSGVTADAEVLATGAYNAILLPAGAIVTGGYLTIISAFTATCEFDVGDAGGDADRYTPTIIDAVTPLGSTALVLDGVAYTVETWIAVTLVTAATIIGSGELVVEYILEDRAQEVQPL